MPEPVDYVTGTSSRESLSRETVDRRHKSKIGKALPHPSALPLLPLGPGGIHVSESTGPHADEITLLPEFGLAGFRNWATTKWCRELVRPSRERVESYLQGAWDPTQAHSRSLRSRGCVRVEALGT